MRSFRSGAPTSVMRTGGTGSFLIAALEAHPALTGTVWELPETAKIAQTRLQAASLSTRARALAGDALADPVPSGHDAILVANFLHLFAPEQTRELLRRLREASDDRALLLLVDFWTDETHTSPAFAALMAGEFLLMGGHGDVYSVDEVQTWLDDTGWTSIQHRPLAGPQTLIIARG